jgi:hypothetical protein
MSTNAVPVVAARRVPAGRGWQWFFDAWTLTGSQRPLFAGLVVAFIVVTAVGGEIPFVGSFAVALVTPVLLAGLVLGCDALTRGERLTFDHLFAGFQRQTRRLLALGAVFAVSNFLLNALGELIVQPGDLDLLLEMFAGVLFGGATPDLMIVQQVMLRFLLAMLVVLALSLPLYMALWFAIPLIALRGLDVARAMRVSLAACVENTIPFLAWSVPQLLFTIVIVAPLSIAIAIRSLLLGLVAVLPLVLGGVLLAALTFASMYTSYRDVFALGE